MAHTPLLENLSAQTLPASAVHGSEVSLIELLTLLLRRKRFILGTALIMGVMGAGIAYFLPVSYSAEAVIMPPQQQQSSLASFAAGALGGLAGGSMASQLGLKSPADLYIGILGSRTITDDVIERLHLREVYKKKFLSDTRKALAKHVSFTSGKDSLIKITAEDHDARRAADLANAFVDELHKQNSRLAITDAAQRRLFFEQQLASERDALANAEIALKNTEQSTGMLAPTGQAEALIRAAAQLKAEIVSREVKLRAMRSFATDENPQLQILEQEIKGFQSQLANIEADGQPNSKFELSAGKLPEASLEYIRKFRDLKYHETLYELLAKQYEAARIDEARQAPLIQVVDRAAVPDRKSWPPRGLFALIAAAAGMLAASGWVVVSRAIHRMSEQPDLGPQLESLRRALRS
jgi:uncharacterized protein involved in exopolysaccharide biosynthesis